MRIDHFAHLLTGLSPVVPGPSPVTGDTEMQGGTRLSPVSPVVPGPKQMKDAGDAVQQCTIEDLHVALGQAAKGLPITLHELIEAFGAEGAADWTGGYAPHCHPKFLRAFAVTVAERLERERAVEPPPRSPLAGLPLLREDRNFIEARTRYHRDPDKLLREYAGIWREAAAAEPAEHRKANAGRRAANVWLRRDAR